MRAILERRSTGSTNAHWHQWAAIALVLLGTLRIALTYRELSETVDEVAHIGAGMEWLALGKFTFELKHPPVARIAAATGPYLLGVRSQHQSNEWELLWRRLTSIPSRGALVAATAILSIGSFTVHPDYLSYFDAIASRDPARLVADSDLDWGQDMFRLRSEAAARGVDTLKFAYIGTADVSPIVGVPVKYWDGNGRPDGWVAVSETWYRRGQIYERRGRYFVEPNAMHWLDSAATAIHVGKGIRLYKVPPAPPTSEQ